MPETPDSMKWLARWETTRSKGPLRFVLLCAGAGFLLGAGIGWMDFFLDLIEGAHFSGVLYYLGPALITTMCGAAVGLLFFWNREMTWRSRTGKAAVPPWYLREQEKYEQNRRGFAEEARKRGPVWFIAIYAVIWVAMTAVLFLFRPDRQLGPVTDLLGPGAVGGALGLLVWYLSTRLAHRRDEAEEGPVSGA